MTKRKTGSTPARRTRANGDRSRERILDAATTVATERGYDAASISAVSELSGLPPTSIYWHFADKDDLMAEVIDRSFERWSHALSLPEIGSAGERGREIGAQVAKALQQSPDFLRLGLKLALDRRPVELHAKTRFLHNRQATFRRFADVIRAVAPGLAEAKVEVLTTYLIAGADGIFVANEIEDNPQRFIDLFELHAQLVFEAAVAMAP